MTVESVSSALCSSSSSSSFKEEGITPFQSLSPAITDLLGTAAGRVTGAIRRASGFKVARRSQQEKTGAAPRGARLRYREALARSASADLGFSLQPVVQLGA